MLTREDVLKGRRVNEAGIVQDTGQFQGEPWWVVALWEGVLEGAQDFDTGDGEDEVLTSWFKVDDDLRSELGDLPGPYVGVYQDEQGFIHAVLP